MQVDEYRQRLLDKITVNNAYEHAKISDYLAEIKVKCDELLLVELKDYNEYEFNHIKSKAELILKKIAKLARGYDMINLIKSRELEQDG